MAVTMQDIAAAVNLSRPTVSLILNGRDSDLRIAEATRQRVLETARRLGYRRNELARAVKLGRTSVIAFIGGNSGYTMEIISGINRSAEKHGYSLKLFLLGDGSELSAITRQCREQMVAGVICRAMDDEQLSILRNDLDAAGIPVVQVDNSFPRDWCGRVVSADIDGGMQAVKYLISSGHRRIGLVTVTGNRGYAVLRRQGYCRALEEAGMAIVPELEIAIDYELSREPEQDSRLREYLDSRQPDAVFCVADPLAMKVLQAAHAVGMAVPERLSVVGYADLDYASLSIPPLTTVAQPFAQMGETAADALIGMLRNPQSATPINIELPVRLVIRQSSAPHSPT